MNAALKQKVDRLPQAPGVYLYKDSRGRIIYIGKAKSLKKRVQSYFTRYLAAKTQALVSRIDDIEYILTPSEAQAQILEAALIKEKQPHYNIDLKDDKSFPLIKITDEAFPIVSVCRNKDRENARERCTYFGPYTNAKLLRQALKVMRSILGFRTCASMPKKMCLYGRIDLCPAPCEGKISQAGYQQIIRDIGLFLDSKYEQLLSRLTDEMKAAAQAREYERAAKLRDQMLSLSAIGNYRRHCASPDETEDLRQLIGLKKAPERIEGFDISNISGRQATGAMVSFFKGHPDKNNYRRFRIKTVSGIDDYAMMREVVRRRYNRVLAEHTPLPDLILIDGGKQHLLAARDELRQLGADVPLMSIAKEHENIYVAGKDTPILMRRERPALNLIRRVRDEAHRFCRSYHHLLHKKKTLEQ